MIDPRILKENPQIIRDMLEKRNVEFPLNDVVDLDKKRRDLIVKSQELRHRKNVLSKQIADKKKEKHQISNELLEMKEIGSELRNLDLQMSATEIRFNELIFSVPNLLDESVPIGKNSDDNVLVKVFGDIKKKNFRYQDHVDLSNSLGLLDLDRAGKGGRCEILLSEK